MLSSTNKSESLVDRLHHDSSPIKLYTDGDHPPFYIQTTLLAGVSKKLAGLCLSINRLQSLDYEALRTFMGWIITRTVESSSQTSLVKAWKFGANYEIPSFQNLVMRELVENLRQKHVEASAVHEAYSDGVKYDVLQKVFIQQISQDLMRQPESTIWYQDEFKKSGLDQKADFFRDITLAMCVYAGDNGNEKSRSGDSDIQHLLVDE